MRSRRAAVAMFVVILALGVGASAAVPTSTVPAACTIGTTLRVGSTGEAVRCLQSRLDQLGYDPGPVDGQFGTMTRAAVVRFQRARGLTADGIVGRETGRALGIWGRRCT